MGPGEIKISVVIPAHNEANYIGRCLDAIFEEIGGRNNIEVIVVDNNSTDGTDDLVLKKYPAAKLIREPRTGANRARQTGFEAARGEFVAIPDADTMMPKNWLDDAAVELEKNPDAVCISGPFIYCDLPKWTHFMTNVFYILGMAFQGFVKIITGRSNIIQGGNYMVKRAALTKIGGLNIDLPFWGDDTDLALRLSEIGKVKFAFKLKMPVSGRRLAKEGVFTMGFRYTMNNLWILLFKRPFSDKHEAIRFANDDKIKIKPRNRKKEYLIASSIVLFFLISIAIVALIVYYLVYVW